MARVIAGFASSHAFTFLDPSIWDERRQVTRGRYASRYGYTPPEQPGVAEETLETNEARYSQIRDGLSLLRTRLQELKPDTLVLIGDDQDENYRDENLPQLAIYTGEEFVLGGRTGTAGPRYRSDTALARAIHEGAVDAGFDLAGSSKFKDDALISHAHTEVLRYLDPGASVPAVLIFVNAIHVPGPTPARCYAFGKALRQLIESTPDDRRVVLYASGGLSHYTAGFPWPHYQGEAGVGSIDVDFDRRSVALMREGRGSDLVNLTSKDLLDTGNIEMRQWIVLQGALGEARPKHLVYEPFFRGVMGMAVGLWELQPALAAR